MLAHEEGIHRGDPAVKVADRRFQVLRPIVVEDHRTLAGDRGALGALACFSRRGGQECGQNLTPVGLHRTHSLIQPVMHAQEIVRVVVEHGAPLDRHDVCFWCESGPDDQAHDLTLAEAE